MDIKKLMKQFVQSPTIKEDSNCENQVKAPINHRTRFNSLGNNNNKSTINKGLKESYSKMISINGQR